MSTSVVYVGYIYTIYIIHKIYINGGRFYSYLYETDHTTDLHDIVNLDFHRYYVYSKINLFKLEGKEDQHHCRFSSAKVQVGQGLEGISVKISQDVW
jgi:hypothetical protein